MKGHLRIGTRRSALAVWQAEHIAALLAAAHPGLDVSLVKMTTSGDSFLSGPLSEAGGKGLFTREIEEALLRGDVDLAVHSLKDLPAGIPEGLVLDGSPPREDPRDALCAVGQRKLGDLAPKARIGTSSLRRTMQLQAVRSDLRIEPIRGNVATRLQKLDEGFDGVVLAAAGLKRLGLEARASQLFETHELVPAVGQGILALERRTADERVASLLAPLADRDTVICAAAERALLTALGAGCNVPLGAHAIVVRDRVRLVGLLMDPAIPGCRQRVEEEAPISEAAELGRRLGAELLAGPARGAFARK